ncbi:RNB domain-containing ribonuclease [Rhodococcus sp. TAF43]|uniref:RNB domain-containing ribonuclease n=1 Tax=unclassified Rhodococcus (in: high G+C Gram-positive bacteria) TaxID=192944 RepID=UPI000E0BD5F9|nr:MULTISPECIES: RNB domain-containing ribonuclease [unclassified Rhodococcus (in: high G+C Gram-positive bacteria)]QKT14196.1 RNB domain-containing ribonuclease [Rhodococcus sp. W8901]RDI32512.1 VacB/RNase II family 3'-5' exoribonuclease [Rhodococcus sp. AG1013]
MARVIARGVDFDAVRAEFALREGFSEAVLAEVAAAVDARAGEREDRTDLAFVTIDPPGSMDLDQALHLERNGDGFVLHYAIADVAAVVLPGGALDRETRDRGQTFYLPDGSVPLHPRDLSEDAASLLPDVVRPAVLWRMDLDEHAEPVRVAVTRALVRSVARFDYATVQAHSASGTLHPSIAALPAFGRLRAVAATERGAIELRLPEQRVVRHGNGWRVEMEPRTEADDWNAEVSLLTGMCAARLMLDAGVGLLRTMPPPATRAVESLRRTASALGVAWADGTRVGEVLAGLDPNAAASLVMMTEATSLMRGADYVAFDGELPAVVAHSGIGGPYAHVTAPLRRLSDRFTTEVCLAVSAGEPVPEWVREALPTLPALMRASDSRAGKIDRACVDLTEATLLAGRVGEVFDATVLRAAGDKRGAEVFVPAVSVIAKCAGDPAEGDEVKVRLVGADVAGRSVQFAFPA